MYGGMWKIPVPDIRRTDLLVVMGANPHASQGSLLACPDVMGEIDAHPRARRQGRSWSTRAAPAPPSRPTSGCRSRPAPTPRCCSRSRKSCSPRASSTSVTSPTCSTASTSSTRCVADWTPERVAAGHRHRRPSASARSRTSSPTTERAVVYGRIGLCNQEFGTLASWLVDVVNILTGHFDAVGGLMFPRPAVVVGHRPADARARGRRRRTSAAGRRRVRGAPEVLGHVPVSCLAEEIATPGDGPDPGAVHRRRQPGAVDARRRPARRGARRARLHDQRRQLAERDDPPRRRDPPRPVAARAAAPRRPDLELRGRQRGQLLAGRSSRPTDGRPEEWEILIRLAGACLGHAGGRGRRRRDRRRVLRRARRRPAASTARRSASSYDRRRARAACSTSRCAPGRSATATARSPTG